MKKTYIYIIVLSRFLPNKPLHETKPVFKLALSVRCFFGHSAAGCVPPAEGLEIIPRSLEEVRASQAFQLLQLRQQTWWAKFLKNHLLDVPKIWEKNRISYPINWCRIVSILDNLKLRYYVMSPSSKSVILLSKSLGPFSGGHHQNSHHPGCQDPDPLLHNGWGSYQTWVPWRRSSPATWWPPLPRCPCDRDEPACWSTTDATTLHYQLESFKQLSQASFQALPCTRCFSHLGFAGE